MKCIFCGSDMISDDKDITSRFVYDEYFLCSNEDCYSSCIEEHRKGCLGSSVTQFWHIENGSNVEDKVIYVS